MSDIIKIINELGVTPLLRTTIYIMILVGLLYKPVISFWYDISRGKLNRLKEAYDFAGHDADTKKFLEISLSEEYFKLATGLPLGFGYQTKLMKLYLKNNAPVAFHHYKRVAGYLKFNNKKTIEPIKIPKHLQIIGYIQAILGFYLILIDILIFIKLFHIKLDLNTINFSDALILTGIFIVCGIILFSGFICVLNPYLIYKSSVYVNRQIGSIGFTCLYHEALEKGALKLPRRVARIVIFYIPIPLVALLLVIF